MSVNVERGLMRLRSNPLDSAWGRPIRGTQLGHVPVDTQRAAFKLLSCSLCKN